MSRDLGLKTGSEFSRHLRRVGRFQSEVSTVVSPGSRQSVFSAVVKSQQQYNFYNVRRVETGEPGSIPSEIGDSVAAVNLAESFTQQGQLTAGTYIVLVKVGSKYVFYAEV